MSDYSKGESKNKLRLSEEQVLEEGGYKLIKKLAEGGYAKVYSCEFYRSPEAKPISLACKIMNTSKISKRFSAKFLPRELKCLIKFNHPYIIHVHSIFLRKNKYFIFMRLAEKGDLLDHILKHGVVKQAQARVWTRQIALALQYMHTLEIAHRDIKCENLLITAHNNIKVSDFGFARSSLNEDGIREFSETFCGSLSYAAPEILRGAPYEPKSVDLWSFGIVIFVMLNKSNPFETGNTKAMYDNQMDKNYKFRNHYPASEEVKFLVSNLLEPDVSRRYKIAQVLNSEWLAMDANLRRLDKLEFEALSEAMNLAKSIGVIDDVNQDGEPSQHTQSLHITQLREKYSLNKRDITYLKEYEEAYDLNLINSKSLILDGRLSL